MIFISERHWYLDEKLKKRSRTRHLIKNLHQTYRSFCLTATLIVRLFVFIDKISKNILIFIEKLIQILKVIDGWIQMLRAIFTAIHLVVHRLMVLIFYIHRIFQLLIILFEPLSNRSFEKSIQDFSNFLSYYYSSNGACYTLQARTRHIIRSVRTRWKRKCDCINQFDDDDIYYDALGEENQ